MKQLFDRKGSVFSDLDEKQKKHSTIAMIAVMVFFVLSAFTFMNFLYSLSDCIGSIVCASADVALRDALRSLPIFLSFFMTLSGLMVAQTFFRNENAAILRKKVRKHAVIGIVIGAVIALYTVAMRFAGRYLSLVEGAPSALYPLDAVLYAILFIVMSVLVLKYVKKESFAGACRAPLQNRGRGVRSFFRTFWLLIALYGFCGFFYSLFIVDFAHGYLFYSLAIMLVSLIAFLSIAVWELYYNNLTHEKRRAVSLPLALVSLVASLAAAILYFVALKGNLDGPANVGFGILPIAFAASVNFATLLVVAMPLIVSCTALVKGLVRKAKKSGSA